MVQGTGGSDTVARASTGSMMVHPGDPGSPINVQQKFWFQPKEELGGTVWILGYFVVKPRGCGVVVAGICPPLIVVRDLSGVAGMGPVEEMVEVDALCVGDGVDCYVGIRGSLCKLANNPFEGAASVVIISPKDPVVPVTEMGVLLVKDLQLLVKECIEVAEHEG